MLRLLLSSGLALLLTSTGLLQAGELPEPQGRVLLKVTGPLQVTNQGEEAHFDRALLESLEQQTTQTLTPWTEEVNDYTGPLGRALVETVGAEDATWMTVTALNGYQARLPVADFMEYPVILALKKNDRYLRIRDRGPIFIIYPFDAYPQLHSEMHYNRSVWQVKAIEFHE
ncbi:molybdopterin-dependent oxidoreductase [Marinospirillum perlucidum]|uniref:molybdopterin-dependent oxidoreductase n=1 Tax=Marinospirillum perlucidum TaxID=1982602 RepID=UPI000DF2B183|nr:molybdopterin-dependent oxidoreductase [Marinospirillum perlucidum]